MAWFNLIGNYNPKPEHEPTNVSVSRFYYFAIITQLIARSSFFRTRCFILVRTFFLTFPLLFSQFDGEGVVAFYTRIWLF